MTIHALRTKKAEQGMTLVELLIALTILVIGMGAIMLMITAALAANNGSKHDTNGTMLAQLIAEQVGSVPANTNPIVTITDCAGNVLNIATVSAAGPNGAGALLIAAGQPQAGDINWLGQTYAAAPVNYKMQYVACGGGAGAQAGTQQTYEVRWNIITLFQTGGTTFTKMVTVSARRRDQPNQTGAGAGVNRLGFSVPVTIRTIVGQ